MLENQPPEKQPQISFVDDIMVNGEPPIEDSQIVTTEKSVLVNTVEKISGIVSPYFIVIVGLYLYENNFLFGTILIAVGILSLLKISTKDIGKFFDSIKNFLGFDKK